ncbi:hypothetical protein GGI25_002812 [Coemansia spiralis]|uniref:Ribosome biogenesis protein NOP53 n=2 Tax=Coemansia TaxID=4863 RepID=A0A9W8KY51_9FUNG|nr:hypothetical protein EDC05_004706 [Coemansia umbellata]KAJ2622341.1 hypothetical protein GGI26_003352 [Coemansia sp. RSA 1358]KAJ2677860.1 hypothetical protein GGI25_002812 [Coemansia spiralis]
MSLLAKPSALSSDAGEKTTKKTRGGRKGKSDWRKGIDLADVEAGLEELREEERQGGIVEERQDTELFVVDVAGDEKTKSKQKQMKKLRVDEILGKRSNVKVPVLGTKMSVERKKKKEAHELKKRLKKIAGFTGDGRVAPQAIRAKKPEATYDIWGVSGVTSAASTKKSNRTRGAVSREKLAHLSLLPAVEVVHPGASYRPDENDHKALIQEAGNEYASELRAADKLSKVEIKGSADPIDGMIECAQIVAKEMEIDASAENGAEEGGSDLDSDSSAIEGDEKTIVDSESDDDSVDQLQKSSDPKRKTRSERNRQRRLAQQLSEERKAKQLKKHLHRLEMSTKLSKVVDKAEEDSLINSERKRKQAQEKAQQPRKKIGKNAVPKAPIAVKLSEELPNSLRELQPEANGFSEVFNSLVKRNIIEPLASSNRHKSSKARTKTTEKWTYKDFV